MEEKELSMIEKILDENCDDNIILYDEDDNAVEFEQVAVIPMDDSVYVLLVPVDPIEGVGEDEAIVFVIEEDEDNEPLLSIVMEDDVVDAVFAEYEKLVEEDGE